MPQPGYDRPRRRVDGYKQGSDPFQGITNPDAYSSWSPDRYTTNIPTDWRDIEQNRSNAADEGYGLINGQRPTTPGPFDLPTPGPGGGSPRSRYRGGGGGGGAAQRKADAVAAYDAYEAAMRDQYSAAKVDARFDPLVSGVNDASAAGVDRLGGITSEMDARGVTARQGVADAFSAGDARLQALRAQYGQQQAATDGGFNDILAGYGVQGGVDPSSGYMDRMFANAQAGNVRAGTIFDASAADRGALVGGLQGDVETGMTRDKAALLQKVAFERAAAQQAAATSLAQVLADSGLARAQL